MSHGTLPTMTVVRNGSPLRINVTDYDPETDEIPGVEPSNDDDPITPDDHGARVTIPDDWRELGWPQLRSLAASVSPTPIHGRNDAIAAIEQALKGD